MKIKERLHNFQASMSSFTLLQLCDYGSTFWLGCIIFYLIL